MSEGDTVPSDVHQVAAKYQFCKGAVEFFEQHFDLEPTPDGNVTKHVATGLVGSHAHQPAVLTPAKLSSVSQ